MDKPDLERLKGLSATDGQIDRAVGSTIEPELRTPSKYAFDPKLVEKLMSTNEE